MPSRCGCLRSLSEKSLAQLDWQFVLNRWLCIAMIGLRIGRMHVPDVGEQRLRSRTRVHPTRANGAHSCVSKRPLRVLVSRPTVRERCSRIGPCMRRWVLAAARAHVPARWRTCTSTCARAREPYKCEHRRVNGMLSYVRTDETCYLLRRRNQSPWAARHRAGVARAGRS